MSAIITVKSGRRVSLLTDRAIYDGQGVIIAETTKSYSVRSWTGVVASRGNLLGSFMAENIAEQFGSFDEFLALSAPLFEDTFADQVHLMLNQPLIEIHAAAWSESRDEPVAYFLDSREEKGPAFEWREFEGSFSCSPFPTNAGWHWLHRQGLEIDTDFDAEDFDAERHGLPWMEAMRRVRTEAAFLESTPYAVGCGVDVAEVTREGVSIRSLRTWPDQIGALIEPGPLPAARLSDVAPSFVSAKDQAIWWAMKRDGALDPVTLLPMRRVPLSPGPLPQTAPPSAGLNRQQRRALERQQRQGVA
mgnify:CR=1 FL=1